jgi:hypothetical protein
VISHLLAEAQSNSIGRYLNAVLHAQLQTLPPKYTEKKIRCETESEVIKHELRHPLNGS